MIEFLNMDKIIKYVIGIDEVGRGPIAGPVAVCAFICAINNYELIIKNAKKELKIPLRDSKKLNKKQRELWFNFLKTEKEKGNCDFAVSFVSSDNIDEFGIVKCIQKALDSSLLNLLKTNGLETKAYQLFLDGGLKAPAIYKNQETIIKGDELHPIISLASIVAKVSRDRIMNNYAKEFPEYGFDKNVGYGTKAHYEALKKQGQTPIHRKTFIH
jgi:ribonuclease HII